MLKSAAIAVMEPTSSNMLYMDDIKLCGSVSKTSVIHVTRIYSNDIRISFKPKSVAG